MIVGGRNGFGESFLFKGSRSIDYFEPLYELFVYLSSLLEYTSLI